jgi:hypothetical protein
LPLANILKFLLKYKFVCGCKITGYKPPDITKPEYPAKNRVGQISIKKSVISSEIRVGNKKPAQKNPPNKTQKKPPKKTHL